MMRLELKIFKTHEIPSEYWEEITSGFNRVFSQNKEPGFFRKYYLHTPFGYSYHALVFNNENHIIASNSLIPVKYKDKLNGELFLGLSGGTFVLEDYRSDIYLFQDMLDALCTCCAKEGIVAIIGVPNENSFKYLMTFLDFTLVTYLPYYVLPVRFFNIAAPKLAFLDVFSILGCYLWAGFNFLASIIFRSSEKVSRFEPDHTNEFYRNRFFSGNYCELINRNIKCWYRIFKEKGINTLYIFDFREEDRRTFKALALTIIRLLKSEKPDLIVFIGYLRLKQSVLFKLPFCLEPQRLPLTFSLTNRRFNDYKEPMSKKSNWNFGLMNFDVR
jgi:hypothetical protein